MPSPTSARRSAGNSEARLLAEGSAVDAGQALFQMDPAPYQTAYDGAGAAVLQNAQDNLALAEGKAKHYAELFARSAIDKQEYGQRPGGL